MYEGAHLPTFPLVPGWLCKALLRGGRGGMVGFRFSGKGPEESSSPPAHEKVSRPGSLGLRKSVHFFPGV